MRFRVLPWDFLWREEVLNCVFLSKKKKKNIPTGPSVVQFGRRQKSRYLVAISTQMMQIDEIFKKK